MGLLSDWMMALKEVGVKGGSKGKEFVVVGCSSEVMRERVEGGDEEYGSGLWGGFVMMALSASQCINLRRMLFKRFSVSAEMSS